MLDSWLKEDVRPGGMGPIVLERMPEGLRVLVPMLVDGDGVLSLCQKLRGTKGASVVALAADESAVRAIFERGCVEFTVRTLRYEPPWYMDQVTHSGPTLSTVAQPQSLPRPNAPGVGLAQPPSPTGAHVARLGACTSPVGLTPSGQWRTVRPLCVLRYMDASMLEHLTRPVPVYRATDSPLTVYVCDLMDEAFDQHSGELKGAFHRVWDQGKLAHTPPAQRAELMLKLRSYTADPAKVLVCCSVHTPVEVASSLPGIAYSLRSAEMQALCGSGSAVHRARQVNRRGAHLPWLQLSSQQGCVYWVWLLKASESGGGLGNLRPPSCPCCK